MEFSNGRLWDGGNATSDEPQGFGGENNVEDDEEQRRTTERERDSFRKRNSCSGLGGGGFRGFRHDPIEKSRLLLSEPHISSPTHTGENVSPEKNASSPFVERSGLTK